MVHTYYPLNEVTVKSNYPMKWIEPILHALAKQEYRYFFAADAAYGFYAIPIYPSHACKTAFNSIMGQYYCAHVNGSDWGSSFNLSMVINGNTLELSNLPSKASTTIAGATRGGVSGECWKFGGLTPVG